MRPTLVLTFALLAPPALAQRNDVSFRWQRLESSIDYGVPRLGKYSLADLPPGRTWRLGSGAPTMWTTDMPVLAGGELIAPGRYRVQLRRTGEEEFRLVVEGAGDGHGGGGRDVDCEGAFHVDKKESKKLEMTWDKTGKGSAPNRETELSIQFGGYVFAVPLTVLGNEPHRIHGYKMHGFTVPSPLLAERIKADRPTPVASLVSLRKGKNGEPERLNLTIAENEARLVPAVQASPEQRRPGGGEAEPREASAESTERRGTIQWEEADQDYDHVVLKKVVAKGKALTLEIYYGKRVGHVAFE